jgi:hypothetical protein
MGMRFKGGHLNAIDMHGRIFIELINGPFLFEHRGRQSGWRRPQARD